MERMEEELRGSGSGGAVGRAGGIGSMNEEVDEEAVGGGGTGGGGLLGYGEGRTVRIEDREGGEVVE